MGWGLKKTGAYCQNFLSLKRRALFERGGLNRGFKMLLLLGFFCLSDVKKGINPALIASKR